MTQVTMTITGDVATLRRVLNVLEGTDADPTLDSPTWSVDSVRKFVTSLNVSCREAVTSIAVRSATGHPTSRAQLILESSYLNDDGMLNGVIGSIGRRWHEAFPTIANPFQGRRIAPHADEWFYVLSQDLAGVLQHELLVDADTWRDGVPQA